MSVSRRRRFLGKVSGLCVGDFDLLLLPMFVVDCCDASVQFRHATQSTGQLTFCAIDLNVRVAFHCRSFVSCAFSCTFSMVCTAFCSLRSLFGSLLASYFYGTDVTHVDGCSLRSCSFPG